jgi:PKD repeat protein
VALLCALAWLLLGAVGAASAAAAVPSPPHVAFSWNPGTARTNAPIHFDSTASDPGGTAIKSYAWYFDGDSQVDSTAADPDLAGFATAGDRLVRLVVTDGQGESTTEEHVVHVHDGNLPPRVGDLSAVPALRRAGVPLALACDCSDPDGDPGTSLTYDWDFGDGSPHGSGATPTHTYVTSGDYVIRVTATDPQRDATSNTLAVHVHAGNDPPVLRIGPPRTATTGEVLPFGVYASDDATAETAMGYSWNFGDGTPALAVANPNHAFSVAGDFVVRVTVTDGDGASSIASQVVHVGRPPGTPSAFFSTLFDPTGSVLFVDTTAHPVVNTPVVFTDGSSDPNGSALVYSWNFGDNQTSSLPSPSHTYTTTGDKLVVLTVTDAQGLSAKYAEVMQVHAGNIPPVASFVSSVESPRTGRSVDFFSNASDADSPASSGLRYDWDFGDGSPHSTLANPSHTFTTAGPRDVRLTVTDSGDATVVAARTMTVHAQNLPPEVDLNVDTAYPGTGQSIHFSDASADRDGQITAYSWDFGDGSTDSQPSVNHAYPTAGDYRVTETVTDDNGESTTQVKTVHVVLVPPSISSPPVIGGLLQPRQVLTSGPGVWNGSAPLTYTYQWVRCDPAGAGCSDIAGANGTGASPAYTPVREDVGMVVVVKVTATNLAGSDSASSAPSGVIAPAPPYSTSPPVASGTARDGSVLSATPGGWDVYSPTTYTYQWRRCDSGGCANIAGATAQNYRLTPADETKTVRVRVTAHNLEGAMDADSAETSTIAPGPPVKLADPAVSGTPRDGAALSADDGTFGGSAATQTTRSWQTCDAAGASCSDVPGATGASYTPAATDVGRTVRFVVSKLNNLGSATGTSAPTPAVLAAPPHVTAPPALTGTTTDGQMLTAGDGSATGTPVLSRAYRWRRCDTLGAACADIASNASDANYTLTPQDVGHRIRVRMTVSNAVGSDALDSSPSAVVSPVPPALSSPSVITGAPRDAAVLSASPGVFTGSDAQRAYRWRRCDAALSSGGLAQGCVEIAGATQSSYRLTQADVAHRLLADVTASNSAGSALGTSEPTAVIAAAPPAALAPPGVSGTAMTGRALALAGGSFSGTAPLAYAFQWTRCDAGGTGCADVPGATAANYLLGASDIGHTMRLRSSAKNAAGTAWAISPPSPLVLLTVDAGQVRSALRSAMTPARSAATVRAVMRARGASTFFVNRFGAGMVQVSWYGTSRGRSVLVAKATKVVAGAGRVALKLGLTSGGKALLKKATRGIKLSSRASFAPARQAAITASATVALRSK